MARSSRTSRSTRGKSNKVKIDFSQVGKAFEEDMEYAVEVKEATQEEGNTAPYFKLVFKGIDEEYENSVMYHNASTSPQSLWRLRPLLEALDMDIPDEEFELEAADFVGKQCMVSTIAEKKPGGGVSIKPDEFWPLDDKPAGKSKSKDEDEDEAPARGRRSSKKEEPEEDTIDLDAMDNEDVMKLAEEFDIKARNATKARAELAKCDPEELADACKDLGIDIGGKKEEEPRRGRRSAAKDEEEEAPRGRRSRKDDEEEDEGKSSRSTRGSAKSSKKSSDKIPESEVDEMSEEELVELLEKHDIDIDLDEHRTLRKKKNAVKDALEEAGLLDN